MTGGFIGVDVFFVISGYLISKILIKQASKNKLSYINFYNRRIKRIYPSLIVVLVSVIIIGISKLSTIEIQYMSRTAAASCIFSANIELLYSKHGYFQPNIKTNPLLHLWSLGVEEQFYIIWPFFIWIGTRFFQKKFLKLILEFTLLNLRIQSAYIKNILSFFGVFGILIIIWITKQTDLFPGWLALIPTFCSAFIILAGSKSFINKYILSSNFFVFIGKISYSWYLWHWPLLVFTRILFPKGSESLLSNTLIVVILSFSISLFTYYFIQQKIRYRKNNLVSILLLSCTIIIGISSLIIANNLTLFSGQKSDYIFRQDMIPLKQDFYLKKNRLIANPSMNTNRKPPTLEQIKEGKQKIYRVFPAVSQNSKYFKPNIPQLCTYQIINQGMQNQVFVIGDSHALYSSLRLRSLYYKKLSQNNIDSFPTVINIIKFGTPFLPKQQYYKFALDVIDQFKPKRVFIHNAWFSYLYGQFSQQQRKSRENDVKAYLQTVQNLLNKGIQVYISKQHLIDQTFDPEKFMDTNEVLVKNIKVSRWSNFYKTSAPHSYEYLMKKLQQTKAIILDPVENQCWNDICYPLTPSGYPVSTDGFHYSEVFGQYWLTIMDCLVEF